VAAVILVIPLALALTLPFAIVVGGESRREVGVAEGHDGSYCGGFGGCYCCEGRPPPEGME
jgi:hypothetical protein